jgi:hypothetical protein
MTRATVQIRFGPRHGLSWRHAALLFVVAASCTRAPGPGRAAAGKAEVEAVIQSLGAAVRSGDEKRILALFAFADSTEARRQRGNIEAALSLDSLTCAMHVGEVMIRGANASAAVLAEYGYRENGRAQMSAEWRTMVLTRRDGAWRIVTDEARSGFAARRTDLRVRLEPDSATLVATATLTVRATLPGQDHLILRLNRGLAVTHAWVGAPDGGRTDLESRALVPDRVADAAVIPLGRTLSEGDSVTVTLEYRGGLFNESRERGYSQVSIAPEGCFASWVTSWYPELNGGDAKSTGRVLFDVPAGFTVTCSGRPTGNTARGDRSEQGFEVRTPLDYSFAAARYYHREQVVNGVNLGVFFLHGGDAKADLYVAACAGIVDLESCFFGGYPFDSYAVVEIPATATGALGGSSEQGMNLFPEGMLPDEEIPLPLLAHEMGHSWWGNLVASEDGAVIDEGLAQLSAVLCIQRMEGESAMRRFLKYGWPQYPQSARMFFLSFAPSAKRDLALAAPTRGSADASVLHDLADTKGHFVYQMLRESIGDEAFLGGLRRMAREHARGGLTLDDLRQAWEKESGQRLGPFFDQWFHRPGAPEFAFADTVEAQGDGYLVRGAIRQEGAPFAVDAEVVLATGRGAEAHRVAVAGARTPFSFHCAERPKAVLLDPDYKLFRWDDEWRSDSLAQQVASLRGLGRLDEAMVRVRAYLDRNPGSAVSACQLGLCAEDSGDLPLAETQFRSVADGYLTYPVYSPSAALALLHLGRICDLTSRREEALVWYGRLHALPDLAGSRQTAGQLLAAPYQPPPKAVAPSAEVLRRYAGAYSDAMLGAVDVTLDDHGLLMRGQSSGLKSCLVWAHDALFQVPAQEGVTAEFVAGDGGEVRELVLRAAGREFHLTRNEKGR